MIKAMFISGVLITLISSAEGADFLHAGEVNAQEAENSLLQELAATFRPGSHSERISSLEAALAPMHAAVPRETDGTLSHAVVRYVLHRFFVQRHGWFIRGLEPGTGSDGQNSSGLDGVQEWVPSYLQKFLEQLSGNQGLHLKEMAVFAATLEDLIHREAIERLKLAYQALDLSQTRALNADQAQELIETYMIIYNLGGNFSLANAREAEMQLDFFASNVKDWNATRVWLSNITDSIRSSSGSNRIDFKTTTRIVEEIGEQYATFNTGECGRLKSELLSIESKKPGRVRLQEFYKKGLTGVFEFNEKKDYLRDLGALDETDPAQPYVILSNYVSSRPNCLLSSGFYVVCCRNECEDLIGTLERKIAAEMASPKQVLEIVSGLSTESVQAPRTLSAALTSRLHDIAKLHDGHVPLHGRLFAQWMHHAFPRECPFPHMSGSINPQTPDEWMQETGQKNTLSKEELESHASSTTSDDISSEVHKELPWHHDEELLRPKTSVAPKAKPRRWLKDIVMFAMLASMASGLLWVWREFLDVESNTKKKAAKTFKGDSTGVDHYHLA
jgi:hypothetical protein